MEFEKTQNVGLTWEVGQKPKNCGDQDDRDGDPAKSLQPLYYSRLSRGGRRRRFLERRRFDEQRRATGRAAIGVFAKFHGHAIVLERRLLRASLAGYS